MLAATLIRNKREGLALADDEWNFLIKGFCDGRVADYQMSAMAMAICLRGVTETETASLTRHMLASGESLPRVTDRPRVDKHSTGGLGDKVSLILAPLLACCDVDVPMISGRGLGRTGGTLDKLEAIDGFQVHLSPDKQAEMLRHIGAFIIGASENIVPADRKLYALRDVTATVESVGLITASILSKKLAASLDALVMDVKFGSGAFMQSLADATELARSITSVGEAAGLPTVAVLSDMDQPLGRAIGNANEVNESIEVLQGGGPDEVRDLTVLLCAKVLVRAGVATDEPSATVQLTRALQGGQAYERFGKMIAAQGGRLTGPIKLAKSRQISAPQDGWVETIDCRGIGDAVIAMGGGRRQTGDKLNHRVGVDCHVRIGDRVAKGQPILTIHDDETSSLAGQDWIKLSSQPVAARPLTIDAQAVE